MLQIVIQVLLIVTLGLQLVLAIHMLRNTRQQYKNDQKFYEKLCKGLEEQQAIFLEATKGVEKVNTLKKMQVKNKRPGVVFSEKEKNKENSELISKYDKRINDMLHKVEFTDATPNQAYKMYMKLQGFLRKKRALKEPRGTIYVPRTETGNYIIDGKVTSQKKGETNGNRRRNHR